MRIAKRQLAGSGETLPVGVIGERVQSEVSGVNNVSGNTSGMTSVVLPPGTWLILANALPIKNTSDATSASLLISDVSSTSNSLTGYTTALSDRGVPYGGGLVPITTVFIYTNTALKTIYANIYFSGSTGVPQSRGLLQAVRIA